MDKSAHLQSKHCSSIAPLRNEKSGVVYTRPPNIQAKLVELSQLTREQVLDRCNCQQWNDPDYIPSECVLHLVRGCRDDDRSVFFETLYRILAKRVLQPLPKAEGGGGKTLSLIQSQIRDFAFDKFIDLLVRDRSVYEEHLDYYEVRFNDAVAALLVDAQRKVLNKSKKAAPFEIDVETGTLSAEVERTSDSFDPFNPTKLQSADYRSSLDAAIDALTPDHMRIIEMIRLGFPIDSQDPNATTIAKTLQKSEKTIRTYRDEAYAHLHAWLTKGVPQ